MKVRIRFRKYGAMKFIGHLDIMRYFQKAMRRAEIPIAYSGGYSPHMIMSFANPLGVGITSDGEYFDIEIVEHITSRDAISKLNAVMVEGIEILSFAKLEEQDKTGMSIVAGADYMAHIAKGEMPVDWRDKLIHFDKLPEILVVKKSKKSEKEVDIKPLIYKLDVRQDNIYMLLAAGSVDNLKPSLVIEGFLTFMGIELSCVSFSYHRLNMYAEKDGALISMDEIGTVIE